MKKIFLTLLISSFISISFAQNKSAKITTSGYFNCFTNGLMQEEGKPYTCEPSTVVYNKGEIFVANDKAFPNNNSSFFSFKFRENIKCKTRNYYNTPLFYYVNKYEASTITTDKKFLVFSSAFSYPASHPKNGKKYNTAIFVNANNVTQGNVLHIGKDTTKNSIDIKYRLKNALKSDKFPNGPNYIKVEGLTALPNNKLVFGVREIGNEYNDFDYSITLIQFDYEVINDAIQLKDKVSKIYKFTPDSSININTPLGISSVEYNAFDGNIYFVTSYELSEDSEKRGAYLWYLSLEDFNLGKKPNLVMNSNNKPLNFKHKIEGLTIIGKNKLLLIADDDRVTGENGNKFSRKLNQAFWCTLKLK